MDDTTPLDRAHGTMAASPEDAALRLAFFECVAESELFVLLDADPQGDQITPRVFDIEDGRFVVAFDREVRLAEFAAGSAPYAALSGRSLVALLRGQKIGLGLNVSVAPSSFLIPVEAVDWLAATLASAPQELLAQPAEILPPTDIPEILLTALGKKLALAGGLASGSYLAGVRFDDERTGHLLGIVDAVPGAEPALTQAVSEALIFSGIEAGTLDVAFFRASDPICGSLARVGIRFDLPDIEPPPAKNTAPGRDPDKPPILR